MSNDNITLDSILNGLENDGSLTKEASTKTPEVVKDAEATLSIADELESVLTKSASENQPGDDSAMNTTDQGNSIATQILTKLAAEGNNAVINQTAALVAGQDAATDPTPVVGKSVSETAKAILERGAAAGGTIVDDSTDTLADGGVATPTSDGTNIDNVPSDLSKTAEEDDLEKIAAVATLMDSGIDFDSAVDLVKEAEEAILCEEFEQVKVASVNALMDEGIDLTSAVLATEEAMDEMSKEAADSPAYAKAQAARVKAAGGGNLGKAKVGLENVSNSMSIAKDNAKKSGKTLKTFAKKNPKLTAALAAGSAVAGMGAGRMSKTAAAIDGLVDAGYTTEEALVLLSED